MESQVLVTETQGKIIDDQGKLLESLNEKLKFLELKVSKITATPDTVLAKLEQNKLV